MPAAVRLTSRTGQDLSRRRGSLALPAKQHAPVMMTARLPHNIKANWPRGLPHTICSPSPHPVTKIVPYCTWCCLSHGALLNAAFQAL